MSIDSVCVIIHTLFIHSKIYVKQIYCYYIYIYIYRKRERERSNASKKSCEKSVQFYYCRAGLEPKLSKLCSHWVCYSLSDWDNIYIYIYIYGTVTVYL